MNTEFGGIQNRNDYATQSLNKKILSFETTQINIIISNKPNDQ